ncbi:MAG: transcriptional repressor [Prevotellaceae bacterium]|jgi:Fur family ferric uptake transcriptional regulator|nr:transcriptional repressor [Prevotellaceae bacterium]
MTDNLETRLIARGIKPTAVRLLVFREIKGLNQTFSLHSLEARLQTVDKSTLFRTILLFHRHHLIHSIDDGSGAIKYSLCSDECNCEIEDLHPHFYCEKCKKTSCLTQTQIPKIQLPKNYVLSSINFVLKGYCNNCK